MTQITIQKIKPLLDPNLRIYGVGMRLFGQGGATSRPKKDDNAQPRESTEKWTRSDIQKRMSSTTKGRRPLLIWVSEAQSILDTRSQKSKKACVPRGTRLIDRGAPALAL